MRKVVATELLGKTVKRTSDKCSRVTRDGHAIAFRDLDGNDCGATLINRGLVRRHPHHRHMRNHASWKPETATKRAKVGIWRK